MGLACRHPTPLTSTAEQHYQTASGRADGVTGPCSGIERMVKCGTTFGDVSRAGTITRCSRPSAVATSAGVPGARFRKCAEAACQFDDKSLSPATSMRTAPFAGMHGATAAAMSPLWQIVPQPAGSGQGVASSGATIVTLAPSGRADQAVSTASAISWTAFATTITSISMSVTLLSHTSRNTQHCS